MTKRPFRAFFPSSHNGFAIHRLVSPELPRDLYEGSFYGDYADGFVIMSPNQLLVDRYVDFAEARGIPVLVGDDVPGNPDAFAEDPLNF
jgi:hypothetical protein